MTTKIYVLCEPDGMIRYVGKTKNSLAHRLACHLLDSRRFHNNHKSNWIRSLVRIGYLPTITLIGEVEGNGNKEEIAWIKYYREEGLNLTNATEGGEGGIFSKEVIKKISDSNKGKASWAKGKHFSKDHCRKISESNKGQIPWTKGRQLSEEHRRRIREAQKGKPRHSVDDRERIRKSLINIWKIRKQQGLDKCSIETRIRMSDARKEYWKKRKELEAIKNVG